MEKYLQELDKAETCDSVKTCSKSIKSGAASQETAENMKWKMCYLDAFFEWPHFINKNSLFQVY